ncbi:uncharacterized protein LOC120104998 [Phoenix dactylifera]|uniref:Uncharacterized protein LOC120104998 n=1 Tax=Phoenix dactylifera TaxID=42345 RepID=A0A8B8ZN87_PHODC|nr:uncharacterized protein LOC120104998 [Phoenix dactylifera]
MGSTHNFLDERLVKQIGLIAEPTLGFDVALGDGAMLRAEGICRGITLTILGSQFKLDLYPLALRGADLVLGTQWLQSLGPVTFDFAEMWVTFRRGGRRVRLDGIRPSPRDALQPLVGLSGPDAHSYLMQLLPLSTETTTEAGIPTDLAALLQGFADLFEEPHGLPLEREHDHHIEIVPGAEPANVRPYRYPHVQKEEISKMEHLEHLEEVLKILRGNQLKVKRSKCLWAEPKVEYLGHVISAAGVEPDQAKIHCMTEWPLPKNQKELRGFLGLTGYYRRFVEGYGKIAVPLTLLLRKGEFRWTEAVTEAFEKLKKAMTTAPVLALPDFAKPLEDRHMPGSGPSTDPEGVGSRSE